MLEYKQSTQVFVPVRLLTDSGGVLTGKVYTDVTVAIMKSDGTESALTLSAPDWVELTTGSWSGSGTYRLRLSTSNTNTTGLLVYIVKITGAVDYVGAVKVVANEEVDTYTLVVRGMGLLHENSVLDSATYNGTGMLTGGRLRTYNSKANAQAATGTGLVATYTITASYAGAALQLYTVVLEP